MTILYKNLYNLAGNLACIWNKNSSVTYLAIWRYDHISRGRCGLYCGRCGCECGGCASLKQMIHFQWETTASPNFGICDTTQYESYIIINSSGSKYIMLNGHIQRNIAGNCHRIRKSNAVNVYDNIRSNVTDIFDECT
jgi:hypothetical protein